MTACKDFNLLISLRAAGALEPAEATRLDAHLESCAACRAEADADAEVLGLAKLPPLTEAERRAANGLARDVVAELHRSEGRRVAWKRAAGGFVAAAALLVAVVTPGLLGKKASPPPSMTETTVATASATWQEPDLDTLWSDSGVLDEDSLRLVRPDRRRARRPRLLSEKHERRSAS